MSEPKETEPGISMTVVMDLSNISIALRKEWEETVERLKKMPNVTVIEPPRAKVVMEGVIDCIMPEASKRITPSVDTPVDKIEDFPKDADVGYSKMWIVLEGSDPENPWYLEIERPMIPACEWKIDPGQDIDIHSGDRVRVTMELVDTGEEVDKGEEVE